MRTVLNFSPVHFSNEISMGMSFQDSNVTSLALSNLNNFLKLHIIFLQKSQNSYSSLSSILMLVHEAQKSQVGDAK